MLVSSMETVPDSSWHMILCGVRYYNIYIGGGWNFMNSYDLKSLIHFHARGRPMLCVDQFSGLRLTSSCCRASTWVISYVNVPVLSQSLHGRGNVAILGTLLCTSNLTTPGQAPSVHDPEVWKGLFMGRDRNFSNTMARVGSGRVGSA